jgi:hypothetical protein
MYRLWMAKPVVKGYLEDMGVDGRIMLKLNLTKYDGSSWTGFI